MHSSFLSVSFVGSPHDSVTLSAGSIIVTQEINEDWDLTQTECISNICQNGGILVLRWFKAIKNQKPHLSDTVFYAFLPKWLLWIHQNNSTAEHATQKAVETITTIFCQNAWTICFVLHIQIQPLTRIQGRKNITN